MELKTMTVRLKYADGAVGNINVQDFDDRLHERLDHLTPEELARETRKAEQKRIWNIARQETQDMTLEDLEQVPAVSELRQRFARRDRPARQLGAKRTAEEKKKKAPDREAAMRTDFTVAIQTDKMTRAKAMEFVAEKYGLTIQHARRIVKPLTLMRNLRRS